MPGRAGLLKIPIRVDGLKIDGAHIPIVSWASRQFGTALVARRAVQACKVWSDLASRQRNWAPASGELAFKFSSEMVPRIPAGTICCATCGRARTLP